MRIALPKGRGLAPVLSALAASGAAPEGLGDADPEYGDRRLWVELPGSPHEALLLKSWDVPRYVEHGVADLGFVGSDVLEELGGDLLTPLALAQGRCRLALIGRPDSRLPEPGGQTRLATKFPRTARRMVASKPWGAEVVELAGSVELAPLLDLADLILDLVETGTTLRAHGLVELETIAEVEPLLVVNRAAFHRNRDEINRLVAGLEAAQVVC